MARASDVRMLRSTSPSAVGGVVCSVVGGLTGSCAGFGASTSGGSGFGGSGLLGSDRGGSRGAAGTARTAGARAGSVASGTGGGGSVSFDSTSCAGGAGISSGVSGVVFASVRTQPASSGAKNTTTAQTKANRGHSDLFEPVTSVRVRALRGR